MMLLIFYRDGYDAIRAHPQKRVNESRRMKQLGRARPPTPEESKKSIRDCKDLVGRRPIDYPEMLADAAGSVRHIGATHRLGCAMVNASTTLLILALFVSLPIFALFATSSGTPQQPEPIAVLISDIITEGVANKSDYTIFTKRPEDVYVCTHIACRQAEWITDKYGYGTGVVMLWSNVNDSHARTWVEIGNETYVIESINDQYWAEDEHECIFSDQFEIEFVTTAQGWIHAIESSEAFCTQPGGENG
jgi:hypothetical protein